MKDQELISKIQLALMGRAARIRELEGLVGRLTLELSKAKDELETEKKNKVAKIATEE
jgi:hypothetical protein